MHSAIFNRKQNDHGNMQQLIIIINYSHVKLNFKQNKQERPTFCMTIGTIIINQNFCNGEFNKN